VAGLASSRAVSRVRPALLAGASRGKMLLGGLLLVLGVSVLTGLDKVAESWAVGWMPTWVFAF
jgi:cytochrome c-type biogenesis protein